jgi:hypothetical protein
MSRKIMLALRKIETLVYTEEATLADESDYIFVPLAGFRINSASSKDICCDSMFNRIVLLTAVNKNTNFLSR